MFANVRLNYVTIYTGRRIKRDYRFNPPLYGRQQGVKALLSVRAQAVAFRVQRLRTPKKTANPYFQEWITYSAGTWQSTSWLRYCLIKIRSRSSGNHHAIGITAHMDCIVRDSLYSEADKELAALFQVQPLVFRFSYMEIPPPINILNETLCRNVGSFGV